jgi:hypothetical protein
MVKKKGKTNKETTIKETKQANNNKKKPVSKK